MRNKGKEKVISDELAGDPQCSNFSSFLDDGDYFEDPYDGTSDFLVGSGFLPTDHELVGFYLRRKTTNNLPRDHDFIPLVQLYVPGAEPWSLHPGMASNPSPPSSSTAARSRSFLPCRTTEWFFFFSYITPRGPGSSRTAGAGSWVSHGRVEEIRGSKEQILGHKSTFTYKMSDGGKRGASTNWVMHEYRLHRDNVVSKTRESRIGGGPVSDAQKELVLCQIRCTKSAAQRQTEEDGSFSAGRKRRRTAAGALIPDGPENVEFSAPSVPLPPSAAPPSSSSDFLQDLFDWQGCERFVTGEANDWSEIDSSPTNVPSP